LLFSAVVGASKRWGAHGSNLSNRIYIASVQWKLFNQV